MKFHTKLEISPISSCWCCPPPRLFTVHIECVRPRGYQSALVNGSLACVPYIGTTVRPCHVRELTACLSSKRSGKCSWGTYHSSATQTLVKQVLGPSVRFYMCVCVHLCVYVGMFARTFHESAKLLLQRMRACACKGCNYLWPCDMSLVLTFLKCLTCLDSLDMLWIHSLPSLLTLLFSCVHWAYWVHCFPSWCIFWADWDCWVELDEFAEC